MLAEKTWYSVELTKADSDRFKEYLQENEIKYEPSEAYNLIHFECLMAHDELEKANNWLQGGDRYENR